MSCSYRCCLQRSQVIESFKWRFQSQVNSGSSQSRHLPRSPWPVGPQRGRNVEVIVGHCALMGTLTLQRTYIIHWGWVPRVAPGSQQHIYSYLIVSSYCDTVWPVAIILFSLMDWCLIFLYIVCPVRQDGSSSTEGEGAVQETGSVHPGCREETGYLWVRIAQEEEAQSRQGELLGVKTQRW